MADTIEKVETNIEGRDRDDIGNSKEENQFNFGAGVHQEVDPRWKHPGEWQYEEDGSLTYTFAVPFDGEGALVLPNADLEQLTINGVPAKAADVAAQQDGAAVKAVLPAGRYVVRQAL